MADHPSGWSLGSFEAVLGEEKAFEQLVELHQRVRRLFLNTRHGPVIWADCVKAAFEKGIIQPKEMRFVLRRGTEISPKLEEGDS